MSIGKNYNYELVKNDFILKSDSVLLIRCLGNLVKNALEAVNPQANVYLYSKREENSVLFCVKNDGIIPQNIQLQIFQRSFSTKAASGRGIGTYSVKLLVEQYLNGKVSFKSNPELGTVFSIRVPIE